jgi:hypothetical protein
MNTLILDASGHMLFSWKSEHAISHFLHPLHFESSRAIQIGSFLFFANLNPLKTCEFCLNVCFNLNMMLRMVTSLSKTMQISGKERMPSVAVSRHC